MLIVKRKKEPDEETGVFNRVLCMDPKIFGDFTVDGISPALP